MNNLDFTISCTITFFNKKMTNPPNLNNGKYSPHIVIKGTKGLIEITFIDGEVLSLINQFELMHCL